MTKEEVLSLKKDIKKCIENYLNGLNDINNIFTSEISVNNLFEDLLARQKYLAEEIKDKASEFNTDHASINTIFLNREGDWIVELMNDAFEIKYINITKDDVIDEDIWV